MPALFWAPAPGNNPRPGNPGHLFPKRDAAAKLIQNNICIVAVAQRAALPKREEHTPLLQQEAAFSVPGQTRAKDISCFRVAFAQELRLGNAIAAGFRLADGGAAQMEEVHSITPEAMPHTPVFKSCIRER